MYISEINKIFTDEVNSFLRLGWTINAQSMNGVSMNEIAKVDVTNGVDVVRIFMGEDTVWDGDGYTGYIFIKKMMGSNLKPNERSFFGRWECYYEERFYKMPRSHDRWFVKDRSTVLEAEEMHFKRQEARHIDIYKSGNCKDFPITVNILPLVRRFPRCKTVHLEDVTRIYRERFHGGNKYHFKVKGKDYTIIVCDGTIKNAEW